MSTSSRHGQRLVTPPTVRIVGVACRRQDRAPLWLVTSQRDPHQQYTVVQVGRELHCTCLAGRHRRAQCIHRTIVRKWLATQERQRGAQQQQQREAADRRDRALLWTDDRPFSVFKS